MELSVSLVWDFPLTLLSTRSSTSSRIITGLYSRTGSILAYANLYPLESSRIILAYTVINLWVFCWFESFASLTYHCIHPINSNCLGLWGGGSIRRHRLPSHSCVTKLVFIFCFFHCILNTNNYGSLLSDRYLVLKVSRMHDLQAKITTIKVLTFHWTLHDQIKGE